MTLHSKEEDKNSHIVSLYNLEKNAALMQYTTDGWENWKIFYMFQLFEKSFLSVCKNNYL